MSDDKKPEAQAEKPDAETKKPEAQAAKPPYSVSEGRAITSKKGMLGAGSEVKAEYLGGGQKALDVLVRKGIVTKR